MDLNEVVHLSTTEEDTKKMALELANDTGRRVLEKIYTTKGIAASEIAESLDIPLPTVLFHIERLMGLNLIKVMETKLSKKFREIKCYSPAKRAILIIPAQKEEAISQIKNAIQTNVLAPLSLLIAMGVTVAVGWLTQRKGTPVYGAETAEKAAPLMAARDAAQSTELSTLHYFILGSIVLFIAFLFVFIALKLIQQRTSLSK
ncbi:MAG: helix-turn-helix domain-containing protein [Euryarchaeota archaeon]|nr:helix-turn-helix domain-containing protein [Euryarchaeota archaeon]